MAATKIPRVYGLHDEQVWRRAARRQGCDAAGMLALGGMLGLALMYALRQPSTQSADVAQWLLTALKAIPVSLLWLPIVLGSSRILLSPRRIEQLTSTGTATFLRPLSALVAVALTMIVTAQIVLGKPSALEALVVALVAVGVVSQIRRRVGGWGDPMLEKSRAQLARKMMRIARRYSKQPASSKVLVIHVMSVSAGAAAPIVWAVCWKGGPIEVVGNIALLTFGMCLLLTCVMTLAGVWALASFAVEEPVLGWALSVLIPLFVMAQVASLIANAHSAPALFCWLAGVIASAIIVGPMTYQVFTTRSLTVSSERTLMAGRTIAPLAAKLIRREASRARGLTGGPTPSS